MKDRRDSWAAAENIIPSSSGAAKALGFIWPGLKITGKAYRVPVRTGSIAELNLVTDRPVADGGAAGNTALCGGVVRQRDGIFDKLSQDGRAHRRVGQPPSLFEMNE